MLGNISLFIRKHLPNSAFVDYLTQNDINSETLINIFLHTALAFTHTMCIFVNKKKAVFPRYFGKLC